MESKGDEHNKNAEDCSEEEELGDYDNNWHSDHAKHQEEMLSKVKRYLITRDLSEIGVMTTDQARFVRQASHYWLDREDGKLYRKNAGGGNPQLVIEISERMRLLRECHDKMGHRGAYATGRMLQQRFWWPEIEEDVIWYVKSCHLCQVRQRIALETPPVVTHMPSIFQVLHADTVHMTPLSNGCRYIVHGRCGLSSWMEAKALRQETAKAIGQWLFEDIVCRWGSLVKIVTDDGVPFKNAVTWLEEKYGIKGVTISSYNSQANGAVERPHWDLRQMLYKATKGEVKKWFWHLPHVTWADRITVRKGTRCLPYFMVIGVHPMIPLDVVEATWLVKYPERMISSAELIGLQALALAKHAEHIEEMRQRVSREKIWRTLQLESDLQHKIKEFNLKPGSLVLVKNSAIELSADRKMKPRYLGPMVVIRCLRGGAFILAELDRAVWQNRVAAFRVVPYLARKEISYNKEVK